MHDFVPLFTWIIKNVKKQGETPLYAENPYRRCTILFRFGMFLFCSARVSGHPCFKGMRCIVLFRFGLIRYKKGTCMVLFRFLAPWLTPKSRLTGHLKCSASPHPIVYFSSKQRSLSGGVSRNVPNLFRKCARSGICRGFWLCRGAWFCSALWFQFKFDRHNFVASHKKSSYFVPFSAWLALKQRGSALICSAFRLSLFLSLIS